MEMGTMKIFSGSEVNLWFTFSNVLHQRPDGILKWTRFWLQGITNMCAMWKSQRDFHREPVWRHMATLGSKPLWNSQFSLSTNSAAWAWGPIGTMCIGCSSGQITVPWPHCLASSTLAEQALYSHWLSLLEKAYYLWLGKHKLWYHSGLSWILALPLSSYIIWYKWLNLWALYPCVQKG